MSRLLTVQKLLDDLSGDNIDNLTHNQIKQKIKKIKDVVYFSDLDLQEISEKNSYLSLIKHNINNKKLSDSEFRDFVKNTITSVETNTKGLGNYIEM